jgi:hypothetical protein
MSAVVGVNWLFVLWLRWWRLIGCPYFGCCGVAVDSLSIRRLGLIGYPHYGRGGGG